MYQLIFKSCFNCIYYFFMQVFITIIIIDRKYLLLLKIIHVKIHIYFNTNINPLRTKYKITLNEKNGLATFSYVIKLF